MPGRRYAGQLRHHAATEAKSLLSWAAAGNPRGNNTFAWQTTSGATVQDQCHTPTPNIFN